VYEPYDPSWASERLNNDKKIEQDKIINQYMQKGI
jgi:hypothetical protein